MKKLRAALRAMAHEAFWVVLTQPLLPLFYVVGRRMGGAPDGVPILLIHGYTQNRVNFLRIARALGSLIRPGRADLAGHADAAGGAAR